MEKYKYTGPTMLLGVNDNIGLRNGDKVSAEVDVNIATVYKIYGNYGTTVLNDGKIEVAAKYLEPAKPDTIHFGPGDGESRKAVFDTKEFFEELFDIFDKSPFLGNSFAARGLGGRGEGREACGARRKTPIGPLEYIQANRLDFASGQIVRYATRHKRKNGAGDVKKIISYAKYILKTQYGED